MKKSQEKPSEEGEKIGLNGTADDMYSMLSNDGVTIKETYSLNKDSRQQYGLVMNESKQLTCMRKTTNSGSPYGSENNKSSKKISQSSSADKILGKNTIEKKTSIKNSKSSRESREYRKFKNKTNEKFPQIKNNNSITKSRRLRNEIYCNEVLNTGFQKSYSPKEIVSKNNSPKEIVSKNKYGDSTYKRSQNNTRNASPVGKKAHIKDLVLRSGQYNIKKASQFNRSFSENSINQKSSSRLFNFLESQSSGLNNTKMPIEKINNLPCKTTYNEESLIYDLLQKKYRLYKNVRDKRNSKLEKKCEEQGYDFITADSTKAEEILDEIFDNLYKNIYTNYRESRRPENLYEKKKLAYKVFDNIKDDIESLNLETVYEESTKTIFYDFTVISVKEGEKPLVVKTKVIASYFSKLIGEDPMFLGLFSRRWRKYYYIIDESIEFKALEIRNAINIFKEVGFSLEFININLDYLSVPSYVRFVLSNKSSSYVGCYQGQNKIELTYNASLGTILHEIMHSLGFHHEHQRADRTRYLYFDSSQVNFNESTRHNVYLIECPLIGPYDSESITNYHGITDFYGFNAKKINFKKRGGNLSELDKKKLKFVYSNNHCTYDGFGKIRYPQSYYECITCWNNSSCFGACIYCASRDHNGHNLIYHDYKKFLSNKEGFYCDCGIMEHRQACTRTSVGMIDKKQAMYVCYTCFKTEDYRRCNNNATPGVCYACRLKCHENHIVQLIDYSLAFHCNCGLVACKSLCYFHTFSNNS